MYRPLIRQSVHCRRLLSSVPSQQPSKHKPVSDPLPPPPALSQRKPKVDLRPAPIRDPSPSSPSSSQSSKPKPIALNLASSKQYIPQHGSDSPPSLSEVTRTAQEDIKDATVHGVLAPPPADAPWARRILHQAIELFKFYYRGIKMINTHRLQVAALRQRARDGGSPLTRAETRFIATYHNDVKKLIPFLIIVLLLEEIIPLIALYAPSMLPSTCILPAQRVRIHAKKEEKAQSLATLHKHVFAPASPGAHYSSILERQCAPIALCGLLRLSTIGPDLLRTRRVKHHLHKVAQDDQALIEEEMGARLSEPELTTALEERGVTLGGLSMKDARNRLDWWLKSITSPQQEQDVVALRLSLITKSLSLK